MTKDAKDSESIDFFRGKVAALEEAYQETEGGCYMCGDAKALDRNLEEAKKHLDKIVLAQMTSEAQEMGLYEEDPITVKLAPGNDELRQCLKDIFDTALVTDVSINTHHDRCEVRTMDSDEVRTIPGTEVTRGRVTMYFEIKGAIK